MRITDIVNQNAALATANQRVAQRLSEQRQARQAQAISELQNAEEALRADEASEASGFVSPRGFGGEEAIFPAAAADEGELLGEPLGAIVERFVRQRSIVQISLPFATGGGAGVSPFASQSRGQGAGQSGMFNLMLEVEETYRVIEFVPQSQWVGQSVDVQA